MINVISGKDFPIKVIPFIDSAKNSIDIVVFDWRWYPSDPGATCQLFNHAIVKAARRGVKVRAIVNNDDIGKALGRNGVEVKRLKTARLVHCKLMIIDDKIAITGSHNYTQSAFQMNLELSVIITEDNFEPAFTEFYKNLYSNQ